MQQIEFSKFGNPMDVLRVVKADPGEPQAGEVLVEVEAAPIHPTDLLLIRGQYGYKPDLPAIPGQEGVGRITTVGSGVSTVKPGDLVFLPIGAGSWRQQMCIPAAGLFALPQRSDPFQLALLSMNGLVAHLLLSEIVDLRPGDWVVQNAANSSVGQFLVTLARGRGLHTANIVNSGGRGMELKLRELGADAVIVDQGQDLADDVAARVGSGGVSLAVDAVGGKATGDLAACLREGGTVVNYGALSKRDCQIPTDLTVFRDVRLRGFWLARWLRANAGAVDSHLRDLVALVAQGRLYAEIEGTYPLTRFKEAVRHAQRGDRAGKVILTPDARW